MFIQFPKAPCEEFGSDEVVSKNMQRSLEKSRVPTPAVEPSTDYRYLLSPETRARLEGQQR
jgi:hypothetical protein